MHKNKVGLSFLILSFILLAAPYSIKITGSVISDNLQSNFLYSHVFGLTFFIISLLIFASRKSLDAIIIPTGPSKDVGVERADRAAKEYQERGSKILLISGGSEEDLGNSQRYVIYKELRKYGIKPAEIRVEGQSRNTIENTLNSLKKLKSRGAHEIGIASNPSHLDRFQYIVNRAKKEGIVDKNVKIYRLETHEDVGSKIYGFFANLINRYRLSNGIENAKEVQTPGIISKIGGYVFTIFSKKNK